MRAQRQKVLACTLPTAPPASLLGECGALVSGGEWQRLALAPAFLRTPGLLILEEATNA